MCVVSYLLGFNSMKVRLKRKARLKPNAGKVFQFHEGPIKTVRLRNACQLGKLRFNSMKVRLKPVFSVSVNVLVSHVSIP